MAFKRKELLSSLSVPELTRSVVTPCDKLVPVFVESAIREWLMVGFELLVQLEILLFITDNL